MKTENPWPANLVPVADLNQWLAARKQPVFLLARQEDRARLEAIAANQRNSHSTTDAVLYWRSFAVVLNFSMCGICGIVSVSEFREPESVRLWTDAMLEALSHRGPDDTGIVSSKSSVLGATRLAIRGTHDGHQPMVDEATGVVAVCNGEIDNHKELRAWLAERGRPVQQATDVAVIPGLFLELGEAFASRWSERLPSPFGIRAITASL